MLRLFLYFILTMLLPVWSGLALTDLVNPSHGLETRLHGTESREAFAERTAQARSSVVYPQNLPGTFTGGFGEESCRSCHFDYEANHPEGSLTVTKPPATFDPGTGYPMSVSLESKQLAKGGFQLTARYPDGRQAGSFSWSGDRLQFTQETGADSLQYLQHSQAGTQPTSERRISWDFVWTAPDRPSGEVVFNVAANAGNDDLSPFGDWIYLEEFRVKPAGK